MNISTNLIAQYNANKGKPILATPDYYNAFKTKIESAIKADFMDDLIPATVADVPYVKSGDIAILDFCGFTINKCSEEEEKYYDLISLQDFCEDLQLAISDESVNKVVINFDSGGGYTMHGAETCELIKQLSTIKPIYAYTSGYMCSMAYEIASNCTNIIASPSSLIGSIGTYCECVTVIGASPLSLSGSNGVTESTLPDMGIIVTTFQGGTEKTIGSEFIALNNEQKVKILDDIITMNNEFKSMVITNRGAVKDEFMQGQPFYGREAIELGTNLTDGTINGLEQFIQLLSESQN